MLSRSVARYAAEPARQVDGGALRHVTRSRVLYERLLPPHFGLRHLDLRGAVQGHPKAHSGASNARAIAGSVVSGRSVGRKVFYLRLRASDGPLSNAPWTKRSSSTRRQKSTLLPTLHL